MSDLSSNTVLVIEDKVAALKKAHNINDVFVLEIGSGNDLKRAYLKTPERHTLNFYLAKAATEPVTASEVLLDACWLDGDLEIKTDTNLFVSSMQALQLLVQVKEATLKKY